MWYLRYLNIIIVVMYNTQQNQSRWRLGLWWAKVTAHFTLSVWEVKALKSVDVCLTGPSLPSIDNAAND